MTKPPATGKPTEQSVLPLITYWSPPRVSYIGFGCSAVVFTVTGPACASAANLRAVASAPGAVVITTLLVAASTYQLRIASGAWAARRSSLARAASRSLSPRLTTTGSAPSDRTAEASLSLVTATVRRLAPTGIQAPPK